MFVTVKLTKPHTKGNGKKIKSGTVIVCSGPLPFKKGTYEMQADEEEESPSSTD